MIAKPADVVHCRSLLLNTMTRDVLTLHSMHSRPANELIRLTASLKAASPCDRTLEQLVGRLLCDESLSGASWKPLPAMSAVDLPAQETGPRAANSAAAS